MATFDEGEITDLAAILGTNSDVLALHLEFYSGVITDSDKTKVLSLVTDFQAIDDDNVYIEAGPAGFKGRISPDEKRALIMAPIVSLLQAEKFANVGRGSRLVRS